MCTVLKIFKNNCKKLNEQFPIFIYDILNLNVANSYKIIITLINGMH